MKLSFGRLHRPYIWLKVAKRSVNRRRSGISRTHIVQNLYKYNQNPPCLPRGICTLYARQRRKIIQGSTSSHASCPLPHGFQRRSPFVLFRPVADSCFSFSDSNWASANALNLFCCSCWAFAVWILVGNGLLVSPVIGLPIPVKLFLNSDAAPANSETFFFALSEIPFLTSITGGACEGARYVCSWTAGTLGFLLGFGKG